MEWISLRITAISYQLEFERFITAEKRARLKDELSKLVSMKKKLLETSENKDQYDLERKK